MNRQFKGIFIPSEIWLHKELTWTEKALWAEIDSRGKAGAPCMASDEELAKIMTIFPSKIISDMIAKLKRVGLVTVFDSNPRAITAKLKQFTK